MLTTILLAVVAIVVIILVLASRQPDSFRVERRATIDASPDRIFPLINDFHRWNAWSPWEKLDPAMNRVFDGPPSGVGSSYAWKGNSKAGEGRMEIVDSRPASRVGLKLDFIKPWKSSNTTDFDLASNGAGTDIRWSMSGPHTMMSKVMSLFITMDKLVGKDFEEGLANLKRVAEAPA